MTDVRLEVASLARMLTRAGLVHAFGHVSARAGDGFAITSTRPLVAASEDDVVLVDGNGQVLDGPGDELPLETPMHRSIYEARGDVGGIARGHPPAVVAWGTGSTDLPLFHGLGLLAGDRVRVHPEVDLVSDDDAAASVVAMLEGDAAVLLRGNGALAVGATPVEAAVRLFFLEDRARVALEQGLSHEDRVTEATWRRRKRHVDVELRRAERWFERAFGDPVAGEMGGSEGG